MACVVSSGLGGWLSGKRWGLKETAPVPPHKTNEHKTKKERKKAEAAELGKSFRARGKEGLRLGEVESPVAKEAETGKSFRPWGRMV